MIRKWKDYYLILSEDGKKILGKKKSKEEAEARLRQIEYFKHRKD
jgi:hypothetical protein